MNFNASVGVDVYVDGNLETYTETTALTDAMEAHLLAIISLGYASNSMIGFIHDDM